ncbi:hypothetical protein E3T26_06665 [Cryobacterium sp. TMT1-21]|uniref:hypothetical protein n=1 Tax=unclassified Cryobacterium TaxID=2649013 RepID=UPI00106BFF7F|nr:MULTISPECIES: hypothetical protein [unclassified Cryobacterium]TFC80907.1 hypothetical protein E3T24_16175 [Cryobacterium sp. TmT2-59]TFD15565.1 hypothetical protein E3T26_06665 [Cryobacterium sp. TMT1-21]TFD18587.1 hypothetical protein E3T42_05010 [Cryobacterium sp. TMT4-10]TFD28388.1 hypothetical protein E3T32_00535 [Cryobacterium sp. TMT2-23]
MSASPIFVFSAFRSFSDPRLQGWVALREHLRAGAELADAREATMQPRLPRAAGAAASAALAGESGIWRLLAPNNRELGRSSSVYGSFTAARTHVLALQAVVEDMVVTCVTGPSSGTHGWFVTVGDVPVMTSGRWYGAASSSREACNGALGAFPAAIVTEDPRPSADPGVRLTRGRGRAADAGTSASW